MNSWSFYGLTIGLLILVVGMLRVPEPGAQVSAQQTMGVNSACGGGFSEIRDDFASKYSDRHSGSSKPLAGKTISLLGNEEFSFFGFTYHSNKNESEKTGKDYMAGCPEISSLAPSDIEFIDVEMNLLLREYIAAEVYNELVLDKAYAEVEFRPLSKPAQIGLCLDSRCEDVGRKDHGYVNTADLKYSMSVSDDLLSIGTLNKLRAMSNSGNSSTPIPNTALSGILTAARKIAMNRLRDGHNINLSKWYSQS